MDNGDRQANRFEHIWLFRLVVAVVRIINDSLLLSYAARQHLPQRLELTASHTWVYKSNHICSPPLLFLLNNPNQLDPLHLSEFSPIPRMTRCSELLCLLALMVFHIYATPIKHKRAPAAAEVLNFPCTGSRWQDSDMTGKTLRNRHCITER